MYSKVQFYLVLGIAFIIFLLYSHTDLYHRKEPRIGEKVAVKSKTKKQFARAIIINEIDKSYLVHFVDYGHKEIVKKMEIFVLPYKYRHVWFLIIIYFI